MKVAIDSGPLTSGHSIRGVGFYTRHLSEALKKEKSVEVDVVDFAKADLSHYDVIHYPAFHPYFLTLPFNKPAKTVVTIHDLIPLIYPKQYPSGLRGKLKFLIQKLLVSRVDAVITVSETSKKDIVRLLGVPSGRVHVTYEAAGDIFRPIKDEETLAKIKNKYDLPPKFVLYVGDVNYNKNVGGLAEACKLIGVPLVIVGKQAKTEDFDRNHPENRAFVNLLEKYGNDPEIIRVGFVPDEDLVAIFNLGAVYCQPSFYEGFGLPVLQAMACGTPVVCAKTQALVEIAKGASLFADPKNPKEISEKIQQALIDNELRSQLVETGRILARNYSWEKTAKKTIDVYRKVLAGN